MKRIMLTLMLMLGITSASIAQFQKNIGIANQHYHDLNIELINDGSNDYVVAGNLFDSPVLNEEMTLKRLDANGNVIWIQKYNATGLAHARAFDVVSVADTLFVTGSVDVNAVKKVFIAKISAITGALLASNYYDVLHPTLHSRGFHIIYSTADVNGDGAPDQSVVISGFFSDCFSVNVSCTNNFGFVMTADLNLNQIWTAEIDSPVPLSPDDYDMANHITETSDGFFITGSATADNGLGSFQQGVLAHKLSFTEVQLWDSSYWFGNSRDVSVDAYYDVLSNNIYMLVNYSSTHYFGITCLDNSTGVIDVSRTWYANDPDLDRYGFTLMESSANPNNLIITGYDRREQWTTLTSPLLTGQTNLFVYEFDRTNGNPSGTHFQYLVPHIEPGSDDFNFWFWQLPLIYYPDISFQNTLPGTTMADYYHVGYRTVSPTNFTNAELFRTNNTKVNLCDNINIAPTHTSPTFNPLQPSSGLIPTTHVPIVLMPFALAHDESICDLFTGIEESSAALGITLISNPVMDEVSIQVETALHGTTLWRLYDLTGKMVAAQTYDGLEAGFEITVDVRHLASGLYLIKMQNNGQSWIEKVMIQ